MESITTLSTVQKRFKEGLSALYPNEEILQFFNIASEHLLNYSKIDTFLKAGEPISNEAEEKFEQILNRLKNWEPIQYITGSTSFYGALFKVDTRVLIPRPETEELVDWIIKNEKGRSSAILDLGTGSGCIAVSLAMNLPSSKVFACDISEGALAIAKSNALYNNAKVHFFELDLLDDFSDLQGKFQVMVSNPPYVTRGERSLMRRNVLDFEPEIALFVPDGDPLLFYKRIALLARKYLVDDGCLYFEINERFPRETVNLLKSVGMYGIEVKEDLNGKSRMVKARK